MPNMHGKAGAKELLLPLWKLGLRSVRWQLAKKSGTLLVVLEGAALRRDVRHQQRLRRNNGTGGNYGSRLLQLAQTHAMRDSARTQDLCECPLAYQCTGACMVLAEHTCGSRACPRVHSAWHIHMHVSRHATTRLTSEFSSSDPSSPSSTSTRRGTCPRWHFCCELSLGACRGIR